MCVARGRFASCEAPLDSFGRMLVSVGGMPSARGRQVPLLLSSPRRSSRRRVGLVGHEAGASWFGKTLRGESARGRPYHGSPGWASRRLVRAFVERAHEAGAAYIELRLSDDRADGARPPPRCRRIRRRGGVRTPPSPPRAACRARARSLRGLPADGHVAATGAGAVAVGRGQPRGGRPGAARGWMVRARRLPQPPASPARGDRCAVAAGAPRRGCGRRGAPEWDRAWTSAGAHARPPRASRSRPDSVEERLDPVVEELARLLWRTWIRAPGRRSGGHHGPTHHRALPAGDAEASRRQTSFLRRCSTPPFVEAGRDGLVVHEACGRRAPASCARRPTRPLSPAIVRAASAWARDGGAGAGPGEFWRSPRTCST